MDNLNRLIIVGPIEWQVEIQVYNNKILIKQIPSEKRNFLAIKIIQFEILIFCVLCCRSSMIMGVRKLFSRKGQNFLERGWNMEFAKKQKKLYCPPPQKKSLKTYYLWPAKGRGARAPLAPSGPPCLWFTLSVDITTSNKIKPKEERKKEAKIISNLFDWSS